MKLIALRAVFGLVVAAAACSAQALTLGLTGFANGSVNVVGSSPNVNASAGAFVGTLTGAGSAFDSNPFYTYCVELTQSFNWGSPLPGYSLAGGASYFGSSAYPTSATTILDRLGKLFTVLGGAGKPSSADQSAGIQLAVWESIYEGYDPLTLSAGAFKITNAGAANAVVVANGLLASAAASLNLYSISVLQNSAQQDFAACAAGTRTGQSGACRPRTGRSCLHAPPPHPVSIALAAHEPGARGRPVDCANGRQARAGRTMPAPGALRAGVGCGIERATDWCHCKPTPLRNKRIELDVVIEVPRGSFIKRGSGGHIDFVALALPLQLRRRARPVGPGRRLAGRTGTRARACVMARECGSMPGPR